jgi:carbonic anhydrase
LVAANRTAGLEDEVTSVKPVFSRRTLIKALAGGLAAMLPFRVRSQESAAPAPDVQPLWSYEGVTGPEHWSELSPDYSACHFGVRQSPIDLVDATKISLPDTLKLNYRPVTARTRRDQAGLSVVLDPGCQIEYYEQIHPLTEFRFRRPSEHLLSGRALEMEMQFLHQSGTGEPVTLSVFLRQGAENLGLSAIIASLAEASGDAQEKVFALNPFDLMPQLQQAEEQRAFYAYAGSLTAPPCTENMNWIVLKTPAEASPQQIRDFASLFSKNARPAQKLNSRLLLEFDGKSASVAQ